MPRADGVDRAPVIALMATTLWAACVVAFDGLLSLALDVEAVPAEGVGPFVVPVATLAAIPAVLLPLLAGAPRARAWPVPVRCGLAAVLALVLVGAVVRLLETGSPAAAFVYAAASATNVFTLGPAALAAVAGFLFVLAARAQAAGAERPRWPWERREEPPE